MKNKRTGRSLFGLLAKNYLLFTLTLFLIAGGLYYLWDVQINRLYQPVDMDRFLSDPALKSGDYESRFTVEFKSGISVDITE